MFRRPRRWRCSAVALLLVVVVPGVPIARTYTRTCERCAASCPMHTKTKAKLRCHGSTQRPADTCDRTPGIALPGCGFSGEMPLLSMQPATMPALMAVSGPLRHTAALVPSPQSLVGRIAEPPDTPPPIFSA
jgi:hypothetical protein